MAGELFCDENFSEQPQPCPQYQQPSYTYRQSLFVQATADKNIVKDLRVWDNLLQEDVAAVAEDYFTTVQTAIKPHMRKIVTDWMVEVCEDQQCQPEVFALAVNYLDRFLARVNIKKSQFQLLASVCLLLASKFSEVVPLSTEKLVLYTDNSVSITELREWELVLLNTLHWDLFTVTPRTFSEQLFHRLPGWTTASHQGSKVFNLLRRHTDILLTLINTHYTFSLVKPTLLATGALIAASRGLGVATSSLLDNLSVMTNNSVENIDQVARTIDKIIMGENEHIARGDVKVDVVDTNKDVQYNNNNNTEDIKGPLTPRDTVHVAEEELCH